MQLSVIVPTLANHDNFLASCESIAANLPQDSELLIAYNGKADGLAGVKSRLAHLPAARVLQATEYGGISKTCNEALRASSGEYVAYFHDDVILKDPQWFAKLRRVLDTRPDVGMAGGSEAKYIDRSAAELPPAGPDGVTECDWSPTISLTRRSTMEAGCLFDEFYLVGLEDKDWALAFRRKGLKVGYFPVEHEHIGNQGSYSLFTGEKSFLDYYSKEGPRERYFLQKNKDVLKPAYYDASWEKWSAMDRNWKKKWWKVLYLRHYRTRMWEALRGLFK